MSKPLNNKERRTLGSKIRKHLVELGIVDKILMKATGVFKQSLAVENGKLVVKKIPSMQAFNLNRSMTKKFLSMSRTEIAKFLSTTADEMKALSTKVSSEAVEKAVRNVG